MIHLGIRNIIYKVHTRFGSCPCTILVILIFSYIYISRNYYSQKWRRLKRRKNFQFCKKYLLIDRTGNIIRTTLRQPACNISILLIAPIGKYNILSNCRFDKNCYTLLIQPRRYFDVNMNVIRLYIVNAILRLILGVFLII